MGGQLRRWLGGVFAAAVERRVRFRESQLRGWERAVAIPAGWLDKVRSDWELMVPYLLILDSGDGVGVGGSQLPRVRPAEHPAAGEGLCTGKRVTFGLAGFVFVLSLIQVTNGFGMERAIRKQVAEQFAPARRSGL